MKRLLIVALLVRCLFGFYALVSPFIFQLNPGYLGRENFPLLNPFLASWANFDGRHFVEIATQGYERSNYVYFPLYPLVVRIFTRAMGIDPVLTGVLLSIVFYLLAVSTLMKLVTMEPKLNKSRSFHWIVLLFPFSFYYQAVYSESLFFFLSTFSVYLARKGQWKLSGLFATLTCLTHITGLAIIPALMAEALLQSGMKPTREFMKRFFWVGFSGFMGPGIYGTYLFFTRGKALLFMTSYATWQREEITFPLVVFWRYAKIFYNFELGEYVFWISLIEFATASVYVYLCYLCLRYIRISYGVFILATLLISAMSGSFLGFPRYTTHLFPGYMALAYWADKFPIKTRVQIVAIFLLLGLIFTSLFIQGYFLA